MESFVTFESELPDDASYSAGGDVELPGGENIAHALVSSLRERGPWLLITKMQRSLTDWLLRRTFEEQHQRLNTAIAEILSVSPFSAPRWLTREEYES
jgi:hypothetical protein